MPRTSTTAELERVDRRVDELTEAGTTLRFADVSRGLAAGRDRARARFAGAAGARS
jgi:hypothetical protein